MRATTEREAFVQEKVMSRIGLDSIRRFASLSSRDLLAGFLLRNRVQNGRSERLFVLAVMTWLRTNQGTLTGTMSGTRFWSDHGQAVPHHDFSG